MNVLGGTVPARALQRGEHRPLWSEDDPIRTVGFICGRLDAFAMATVVHAMGFPGDLAPKTVDTGVADAGAGRPQRLVLFSALAARPSVLAMASARKCMIWRMAT